MNKETIKRNKATKITVYDAICGTGKSCAAITNIKDSTDRVVIITPLEDEMNRYVRECPRLTQPVKKYKGGGKTCSSRDLIEQGLSFVTSHELAKRWKQADYKAIKEKGYRLIMDENIETMSQYNPCSEMASDLKELQECSLSSRLKTKFAKQLMRNMTPKDINAFVKEYCDVDEQTGLLDLKVKEDENGNPVEVKSELYSTEIELVKEHKLAYDNGCLIEIMPPEFLKAFTEVKILTYMFKDSPLNSYMDIYGFRWSRGYITDEMTFTDTYALRHRNTEVDYESLVTIWDETINKNMVKFNVPDDLPNEKKYYYKLSSSAFKEKMTTDELKQLFKNMHNWCRNYVHLNPAQMYFTAYNCAVDTNSKRCFYTTPSLRRKYEKRHLACNAKATNNYADCVGVAYLINRFSDVTVYSYCCHKGHPYSRDVFATSEMLQVIFRSALRKGEPINIYIPSSRMRKLLRTWLKEQTKILQENLKSVEYDENGVRILQPYS